MAMYIRLGVLSLIFLVLESSLFAQNIHFSQFHQTPLLTNPAMVGSETAIKGGFFYRNQFVGGGQAFTTPVLYGFYPLIRKKDNKHWAGVGAQILSENAGIGGLMRTTGGSLAFAYNFEISPLQKITVGAQGGFYSRNIFLDKLSTGSQWNDTRRTFDAALPNNLSTLNPTVNLPTADLGIMWQMLDTHQIQKAYLGIAARQLNQPNDAFTDISNKIPVVWVLTAGVKVFENEQISVFPSLRHIQQGSIRQTNIGSAFRYHFGTENKQSYASLNTWYSLQNALIAGIELYHKDYFFNFSYDFSSTRPQNLGTSNGAAEIGVGYRKYIGKKKIQKPKPPKKDTIITPQDILDVTACIPEDSTLNYALTGEEFDLFKRSVLFPYGSYLLDEGTKAFLDKIASTLIAKPETRIEISGHTCNTGKENMFISKARAIMVYNYLIRKGIDKSRLVPRGWADKKPITSNESEAGRVRNRRVEFRIIAP
jgi:type IX secretion system PorP/SprF family membrane protein